MWYGGSPVPSNSTNECCHRCGWRLHGVYRDSIESINCASMAPSYAVARQCRRCDNSHAAGPPHVACWPMASATTGLSRGVHTYIQWTVPTAGTQHSGQCGILLPVFHAAALCSVRLVSSLLLAVCASSSVLTRLAGSVSQQSKSCISGTCPSLRCSSVANRSSGDPTGDPTGYATGDATGYPTGHPTCQGDFALQIDRAQFPPVRSHHAHPMAH